MLTRKMLLGMTAAAALLSAPVVAQQVPLGQIQMAQAQTGMGQNGQAQRGHTAPTGNALERNAAGSNTPASNAPANASPGGVAPTPSTPAVPAPGGAAAMQVDTMRLAHGQRASKVIGSTVYNDHNESIGSVDDIVLAGAGSQAASTPVVVVSVGGFLGLGAKLVAVPFDHLHWDSDNSRWILAGANKDSLNALPTFAYNTDGGNR